jgi:hypothetical protein
MTEARSTLIDAGHGRVRRLRLAYHARRIFPLAYTIERGEAFCHLCGCTDILSCEDGCYWVDLAHTVCSRCFTKRMLP